MPRSFLVKKIRRHKRNIVNRRDDSFLFRDYKDEGGLLARNPRSFAPQNSTGCCAPSIGCDPFQPQYLNGTSSHYRNALYGPLEADVGHYPPRNDNYYHFSPDNYLALDSLFLPNYFSHNIPSILSPTNFASCNVNYVDSSSSPFLPQIYKQSIEISATIQPPVWRPLFGEDDTPQAKTGESAIKRSSVTSMPPPQPELQRYICDGCTKSYSTFSGLSKHRQFHCIAKVKKSFSCKYCDKTYISLGALKMHIRIHTLPCKCQLCGKAFSRPWLLQGHLRTHTGEKPFRCEHCSRAFADRSNLRAHLQTHSDIKRYSCPFCTKTFSRMSLLAKHKTNGCPNAPK